MIRKLHMISFPDCVSHSSQSGNETRYKYVCLNIANCIFAYCLAETGDFKIDTTGTYHGMNLKSVTVRFPC